MECTMWPAEPAAYVEDAVAVLERAMFMWPDGELALAFNGGKDCTVLLGLLQLAEAKRLGRDQAGGIGLTRQETSCLFSKTVRMVYFVEEGCFPEQDTFIEMTETRYGFELLRMGSDLKEVIQNRAPGSVQYRHRDPLGSVF